MKLDVNSVRKGSTVNIGNGQETIEMVHKLTDRIWFVTDKGDHTLTLEGHLVRFKAIVADDDADLLEVTKDLVYHVSPETLLLSAGDGVKALEIFKRESVDFIVTDYGMPIQNGLWFIKEVRKTHHDIPIVIQTGNNEALERLKNETITNVFVLEKPLDDEKFFDAINLIMLDLKK